MIRPSLAVCVQSLQGHHSAELPASTSARSANAVDLRQDWPTSFGQARDPLASIAISTAPVTVGIEEKLPRQALCGCWRGSAVAGGSEFVGVSALVSGVSAQLGGVEAQGPSASGGMSAHVGEASAEVPSASGGVSAQVGGVGVCGQ